MQNYFAYGSNMNLDQMARRCPDAEIIRNVRLDGYELAFCGSENCGFLTILPKPGSQVEGVMWLVSDLDIQRLNHYEGWPRHYRREYLLAKDEKGNQHKVMVYIMNAPYRDEPAIPSRGYLYGVLEGCKQNKINPAKVMRAAEQATYETRLQNGPKKTPPRWLLR